LPHARAWFIFGILFSLTKVGAGALGFLSAYASAGLIWDFIAYFL
jgi:hypothetical protein